MFKHILIPTDGSELSQRTVRQGIDFAKSVSAQVTLFKSSPPYQVVAIDPLATVETPATYPREAEKRARALFQDGEEYAASLGVPAATKHVIAERPYEAIIEAAQGKCDLIFMASHGRRGVSAVLLGSETNKVLTHSKIPVLVCR